MGKNRSAEEVAKNPLDLNLRRGRSTGKVPNMKSIADSCCKCIEAQLRRQCQTNCDPQIEALMPPKRQIENSEITLWFLQAQTSAQRVFKATDYYGMARGATLSGPKNAARPLARGR